MAELAGDKQGERTGGLPGRIWRAIESMRERIQDLPGLRPQRKADNQVGLALLPQGVSLAAVLRVPGSLPRVTRCEFIPLPRQADPGLTLRNMTLQAGTLRTNFRLVLNPDEYQIHLVETPDVPDSELREAVRWRVRDLIDFPVDEAAIDVFDMPQQAASGRESSRMMNVVVARTPLIAQKAALVNRSGGELEVIDVPDLVLRNLLSLTPADRTGAALLYVEPGFSLILITSESTLYLSRRVFIGQQDLALLSQPDEQSEDFRRGAGAIALELMRSLEYYETHFARPPIDSLYIAPAGALGEPLKRHLAKSLGVKVKDLDLTELLDVPGGMTVEMQARSLMAIGAALRQDRTTL